MSEQGEDAMYPTALPNAEKLHYSQAECFENKASLVRGFIHRNYQIDMHDHDFYELNLVINGKGVHYIGDRCMEVGCGDLFVIPSGHKHGYVSLDRLDVYHLLIHPNFLVRYHDELAALPGYILLFTTEPVFRKDLNSRYFLRLDEQKIENIRVYLDQVSLEFDTNSPESSAMVSSLTLYIIARLCRYYREQNATPEGSAIESGPRFSAVSRCFEFIHRNYMNPVNLEEMLNLAQMSRSTFLRLFKKASGMTPAEFVQDYRILMAKRLLLETDRIITDVGYSVGFYDSAHFTHIFKKCTGMTPTQYRVLYRRRG